MSEVTFDLQAFNSDIDGTNAQLWRRSMPINVNTPGIPMGGAMDRLALRAANLLGGNPEGAAGLEAVFMGPELEFTENSIVAVCGADLPPNVNGREQPGWTAFKIRAGDELSFDFLRGGARAYIAVAGGITTPSSLCSRSTYAIGALGGIDGRALQSGDSLPVGDDKAADREGRSVPRALRRAPGELLNCA